MTKDELKKEFEKYLKDSSDYYDPREPLTERKLLQMWLDCAEPREKQIAELEKENAELKDQNEKWFVFETEAGNWGMDKATQYTVDRHNYFYGTKNECQIWAVEHKIKDYTGHKYCYDRLDDQLEQAKEIIKLFVQVEYNDFTNSDYSNELSKVLEQAEQFLKEMEK